MAPDLSTPRLSFNKLPTEEVIDRLAGEHSEAKQLVIFVDYDYFPTSSGTLDLNYLEQFPQTTELHLRYIAGLTSLDFLQHLPNLTKLSVGQTKSTRLDLSPLAGLTYLGTLSLEKQVCHIESVAKLQSLKYLSLQSITLSSLRFVEAMTSLAGIRLALGGTKNLSTLPSLDLRYLELWQIRGFADTDLLPISKMASLEYLVLDRLKDVTVLPDFSECLNLTVIQLDGLSSLGDLSTLCTATHLEELRISAAKMLRLEDFAVLKQHPTLKRGAIGTGSVKLNNEIEKTVPLEKSTPIPELFQRAVQL